MSDKKVEKSTQGGARSIAVKKASKWYPAEDDVQPKKVGYQILHYKIAGKLVEWLREIGSSAEIVGAGTSFTTSCITNFTLRIELSL
jgi:hypothetical protein